MAVLRVIKEKNYVVMSNIHLREKEMSLKAKGLLSVILSLPENWKYSTEGLVSICAEQESAITSALKELKEFGYLEIQKRMPNQTESGRIEYIYNIYEKPQERLRQGHKKQDLENLGLEIQGLENQGQLNIYNQYTDKEDIDIYTHKGTEKQGYEKTPLDRFLSKWKVSANALANYPAGKIGGMDWDRVSEKVEQSELLKGRKDIYFFVKNYERILDGSFDDDNFKKPSKKKEEEIDPDFDYRRFSDIKYEK